MKTDLMWMLKVMLTSRFVDDTEIKLAKRATADNRALFQINGCGHEALGAAIALAIKPHDWVFPYYRDRALLLGRGYPPLAMILDALGKEHELNSHGRQMPSHWQYENTFPCASPIGCQFLPAAGCAEATLFYEDEDLQIKDHKKNYTPGEVTIVTGGDGFYCQGEFWEALNIACIKKLPLIFVVEDNGYAISVSSEEHTPGKNVAENLRSMPNLEVYFVNGLDPIESYKTMSLAIERARRREGPSLVHANVIRPYSHSSNDDASKYRTEEEILKEIERDPIISSISAYDVPKKIKEKISSSIRYGTFAEYLIKNGIASEEEIVNLRDGVKKEIEEAENAALAAPPPNRAEAMLHIYSENVDPTSQSFAKKPVPADDTKITMVAAINRSLDAALGRNDRALIFGEDVADAPEEKLDAGCKGKGGVFNVTLGLSRKYGKRVFNTPPAEEAIVGRAVGLAARGLSPTVEIQFVDYIQMNQIWQQLTTLRWRSFGKFSCPVIIRTCVGAKDGGGSALWHSQCKESVFTHTPGLRVVFPSCAEDAVGLLNTALAQEDPVLFLEHKKIYNREGAKCVYPGDDYTIPFGKAKIVREGKDVTIVTYGATVYLALEAAEQLKKESVSVEVIDLRTLKPWDFETVAASFKKTNRALILHEDIKFCGFGAEIVATLAEELPGYFEKIKRVAAKDCFVPYHPDLEKEILPQTEEVIEAIRELMR